MDLVIDTAVKYNDIFMSGAKITIIISLLSCFFGLLLGIILAFMKISGIKILQLLFMLKLSEVRQYSYRFRSCSSGFHSLGSISRVSRS